LTAIKSYLSLLVDSSQRNPLSEEQKIYADRASISTDRLINLVNDMLNVSRIDSGRINMVLEPVKLNELIQEVADEVGPRAKELGLTITINNTPCPFILADKEKIKEVFLNIIGNSLKFTPKDGTITISFSTSESTLETKVSDTGVGIEPQDIPKLFQKFGYIQSAYEAVHSNFPGTGLGLYMCKSLVEQQTGRISASSPGRNQGAIFTVVFPILPEEEAQKLGNDQAQKKTDPLGLIHYQI
jgi:two-component system phosphate regulon sensor histidine kinase PhoR